jgi:DNA-binding response OmpR family regulator
VFAKAELMQAVWGYSAPRQTRTLGSHACRLRNKLAGEGGDGYIANSWGHGYTLLPAV